MWNVHYRPTLTGILMFHGGEVSRIVRMYIRISAEKFRGIALTLFKIYSKIYQFNISA